MPKIIEIPDYGNVEFPDEMTDEQIAEAIQRNINPPKATAPIPKTSFAQGLKNFGAGALAGSADIGNTLINAATYLPRQVSPSLEEWNKDREKNLEYFNQMFGDSTAFDVGRIGANVAGTAGTGGALAKGVTALSKGKKAMNLASALEKGGMAKGVSTKTNLLGGAAQAGLGTALISPEDAETGAAIGAAIPLVGKSAPYIGGKVADVVGGIGTFTGGQPIKEAALAGLKGGQAAESFVQNLRGKVPIADVLNTARANLENIASQRNAAYRQNIQAVKNDKSILSFGGIDDALNNAFNKVTYNGMVKNQVGADVYGKIQSAIADWKNADPKIYHTPEGLDALKQRIGGIVESIPYNEKTARSVGNEIYNSIKSEITKQAPTYSKTMKDYSEASDLIKEIEGSLIGTTRTNPDTALRKLQSVMRNNVNTNYGRRTELAKALETQGGNEIMPALAGQALSSVAPRSLGGAISGGTAVAGVFNPAIWGLLATQSPRLVGEAAYGVGKLAKALSGTAKAAPYANPAAAAYLNR